MHALYAVGLSIVLVCATALFHLQALRWLSRVQEGLVSKPESKLVVIILGLITAHVFEAALFAFGYWIGVDVLRIGDFVGPTPVTRPMMFYFALEAFTTQGLGDVYPLGSLRLLASIEPFAGLILIGWSTSFTFVVMGLDWRFHERPLSSASDQSRAVGRPLSDHASTEHAIL